ncbi:MAG: universal stress protein [bacterium]
MANACPITGLRKILLATDGSEYSEAALREAVSIAKVCKTKLYALSVIEVNPEYATLAPQIVEKAEVETRQLMESVKDCAKKEGVDCEIIIHEGEDPAHFIIEEAGKQKIDMIVMGKHGRRKSVRKLLIGSVTEKVLAHAPCKVLVVPVEKKK